jgi:hypothetical protein
VSYPPSSCIWAFLYTSSMLAARKWLSRSDDIIDITPSQCRDRTSPDSMILMVSILSGTAYGAPSLAIQNIWSLKVVTLFVGIVFVICGFVLIMNFSVGHVSKLSWRPLVTCWLLLLAIVSTALRIKRTLLAFRHPTTRRYPWGFHRREH